MLNRNQNLLNYEFQHNEQFDEKPTLLLIHGLMGDLNNLGMIGRHFANRFNILKIDQVNHGRSYYCDPMDYPQLVKGVKDLVDHLNLKKLIVCGHSMGGKTAMSFAMNYPELVEALIVLDIAPVIYTGRAHDDLFKAFNEIVKRNCQTREEVKQVLLEYAEEKSVIPFLLKSYTDEEPHKFLFNAPVLEQDYSTISQWREGYCTTPSCFIYGGLSSYVTANYGIPAINRQFPNAQINCIPNASHWLHAEKPKEVFKIIEDFLAANNL